MMIGSLGKFMVVASGVVLGVCTPAVGEGPTTMSKLRLLTEHREPVADLAVSRTGKLLASGGIRGEVILRSLPDLRLVRKIRCPGMESLYGLSFSPDGRMLYLTGSFVLGARRALVAEFDTTDGSQRVLELAEVRPAILFAAPSSDGRQLISVSVENFLWIHALPSRRKDRPGDIVRLKLLKERKIAPGTPGSPYSTPVRLSPDRRFVAVRSSKLEKGFPAPPRRLTLIDLAGKAELKYDFPSDVAYFNTGICFGPDSRTLWLYTQFDEWPVQVARLTAAGKWNLTDLGKWPRRSGGSQPICAVRPGMLVTGFPGQLVLVDTRRKELRPLAKIGPDSSDIADVAVIACPPRVIAAMWTGRIAVVPLEGTESKGPTTAPTSREKGEKGEGERGEKGDRLLFYSTRPGISAQSPGGAPGAAAARAHLPYRVTMPSR